MPDSGNLSQARVVVLGAGGFIGRKLVGALGRVPEFQPVALVRRPTRSQDAEVMVCDATDANGMRRVLAGADYAVNCIAGSDAGMIKATNVLCDVARRSGLRRLVHLSSMAVYGAATGIVHETSPALAPLSGYGLAKQQCEQIVRGFVVDGGEAVILRPGCVYGPGSEQWTGRIARLLQAGRLGDLGANGDGICNLTFVDDLVEAIIASLTRAGASGKVFNIAMSDPPDWNSYLTRFARALGATPVKRLPGRQLKLEAKLLAPALRLSSMAVRISRVPVRLPDAITPSLASLFRQEIRLDVHKASEELEVQETEFEWGLAASARWIADRQRGTSAQPQVSYVEAQHR
jgi:nucleoside-diphosphate-sugar epimerase